MDKSQPPAYTPAYTPAQVYQPEQHGAHLYPPLPQQPPQPQPAMPPPLPPAQHSTVIIQTTSPSVTVGSGPTRVTCPSCRAEVLTSVQHSANSRTHCWALVLCLFICWPCVCIPYCMDSCQSANHYCPNCGSFIGQHNN